jgi:hypothetical protein
MTRKIDEKRVGRAMNGALLLFESTIGGKKEEFSVGQFTSNLARYGRGVGALARSVYYFVPSGKYGGGGTLSPAMAADAAIFIRKSMLAGGNNPNYKGPPMRALGDKYANWKDKVSSFRGSPLMRLTGTMAASIGVRKSAGGRMVVTFDGDRVGPPASPGRPGVKVSDYVYVHELGTGGIGGRVPQRSIITGSMAGWIAIRSHSWSTAFQRLMRESVWLTEDRGSREDLADDIVPEGTSGSSAIDILSQISKKADVLESLARSISQSARDLLVATARGAKGSSISEQHKAMIQGMLRKELSGSGYSAQEVEVIIDIALSGRIPNEYIFD